MVDSKVHHKKHSILIVDDEKNINDALVQFVELQGYSSMSAYDGEEGFKRIIQDKPDLVLLDVVLPKKNGYEVCRMMREREDVRHIPVIMLTTLSDRSDRIKGIEAGCDEFAQKPVSFEELKVRIASLLKINYYRSMLNEKEKFERIVSTVHDGIIVLDNALRIVEANPSGLNLLNIPQNQAAGLDVIAYIKEHFAADIRCDMQKPKEKDVMSFEVSRPETEKTNALFLFITFQYMYDPDDNIQSVIMTIRDITDVKKEELIKRNFISLISHKLLTPLAVIKGKQDMIQDKARGIFTDELTRLFKQMTLKTEQLQVLIEKLLVFVEIHSSTLSDKRKKIILNQTISKYVKRYFSAEGLPSVDYTFTDKKTNIEIEAVPHHIELILQQVLDNAIKHNPKKEKKVSITITVEKTNTGNEAVITIEDNGSGIPSEEYDKIFDAFYQVEKYFTGNKEGVGVGLALVKQLVELYRGSIKVSSKLNKGSIFTIHLPITV